jgi:hypothetical protein
MINDEVAPSLKRVAYVSTDNASEAISGENACVTLDFS